MDAELISRVKQYQVASAKRRGWAFEIIEAKWLSEGVLAVRDADDEYCVFVDLAKIARNPHGPDEFQTTAELDRLPDQTGLITNVMAANWRAITETAKRNLVGADRRPVMWHKLPVTASF